MKNTKGKQKIEMKMIEDYESRMTTLSKRKAGLIKKMNEIVAQCGVEASFLGFTQAGKAHSFAHPSMEDACARVKNTSRHELFGKDDTDTEQLVEAYKRQKSEVLKEMYAALAEELEMVEEEKKKELKESESGNKLDKKWWIDEGLTVEEVKKLEHQHQAFVEFNVNICASQQFGKDGEGSSTVRGDYGGGARE